MVSTLILYDAGKRAVRERIESVLRAHGCMWLFPAARWSTAPLTAHGHLVRQLRARLRGETYRVVMIDMPEASRREARWVAAAPTQSR